MKVKISPLAQIIDDAMVLYVLNFHNLQPKEIKQDKSEIIQEAINKIKKLKPEELQ